MAKLEFNITFDTEFLNKVIRQAESNLFCIMFDDDTELQEVLNINGISESED